MRQLPQFGAVKHRMYLCLIYEFFNSFLSVVLSLGWKAGQCWNLLELFFQELVEHLESIVELSRPRRVRENEKNPRISHFRTQSTQLTLVSDVLESFKQSKQRNITTCFDLMDFHSCRCWFGRLEVKRQNRFWWHECI